MLLKAKDLCEGANTFFGYNNEAKNLKALEKAVNRLLIGMGAGNIICRLRTWDDAIPFSKKDAVLLMMRAEKLYQTDFFDEAQKFESLAVKYANNSN